MKDEIVWYYVLKVMNKMFLNGAIREIPVFIDRLEEDMLGEFRFTDTGINSIILANNADMSEKQMMGVLLHEMVHQLVFQKYGPDVEEHGKEWLGEIKKIGFVEEDLTGLDFITDETYAAILHEHSMLVKADG